jgi:hypothetical protein
MDGGIDRERLLSLEFRKRFEPLAHATSKATPKAIENCR